MGEKIKKIKQKGTVRQVLENIGLTIDNAFSAMARVPNARGGKDINGKPVQGAAGLSVPEHEKFGDY